MPYCKTDEPYHWCTSDRVDPGHRLRTERTSQCTDARGLFLATTVSPRWRVAVSLQRQRSRYVADTLAERLGITALADPLGGNLLDVTHRQTQWQVGGGAQYRFSWRTRWHPTLSLMYWATAWQDRQLAYRFYDAVTIGYQGVHYETHTQPRTVDHPTYRSSLELGVGAERRLGRRVAAHLEGYLRLASAPPGAGVMPTQVGLRTQWSYAVRK